jgi:flagellar hook-associated protein 1 FlgK
MSGLFSIFNTATRGMTTQQRAINVTSHNIANANTEGFTRQRVVIETTRPFGMPSLSNAAEPGQMGTGSQVSAIQRVRDSFLDYQVRTETSTKGEFEAREKFLGEVEGIMNEPGDTGLSTLIGKFFDSWQTLSNQPQSSNARTVVAQQTAALTDSLNHTAIQLDKLKDNAQMIMKDSVFELNNMLGQIDQLNQQIIGVKVSGNEPNDLQDKRDLLLDQLSAKFNLTIENKEFGGIEVRPSDASDLQDSALVKSQFSKESKRFSYVSNIEKVDNRGSISATGDVYKITYYKNGNMKSDANKVEVYVSGMSKEDVKQLDECRVLWAENDGTALGTSTKTSEQYPIDFRALKMFQPSSGDLKGYMSVQSDINDYNDQLDKLAKAIAFSVNAVHSGMEDVTSTGDPKKDFMPYFVNSDVARYDNNKLVNLDDDLLSGKLGVLSSEKDITAKNISINKQILSDVMQIKTRTNDDRFAYEKDNNIDGETDGKRALAIAKLRDSLIKIQDIGGSINERADLFKYGGNVLKNHGLELTSNVNGMKVDNYFRDVIDRLGVQSQEAIRMVKNQDSLLDSFQESRESVSGVSLDEEMANLVQFQHAYQANAKVISTVDELLDVVINGLKK